MQLRSDVGCVGACWLPTGSASQLVRTRRRVCSGASVRLRGGWCYALVRVRTHVTVPRDGGGVASFGVRFRALS